MAKRFLEGVNLKSQNQRNGFDVSYQNQFTVPFGMMLPFFFQRVNPDDKIKIAPESQTICDGLVKPAFMRLREHMDYYFIPATQLWMPFDEFVTGQNSYFSSYVGQLNNMSVPTSVPTFNIDYLGEFLRTWSSSDALGYNHHYGMFRLLDMLGYMNLTNYAVNGWSSTDIDDDFKDKLTRFNFLPLLCYQKVYYDYFRNTKYEDNDVEAYNIDDLPAGFNAVDVGTFAWSRFAKITSIHYRWQKKDYFTQTQPNVLVDSSQIGYTGLSSSVGRGSLMNVPGLTRFNPSVIDSQYGTDAGKYVKTGGTAGASGSGTPTIANVTQEGVSVANIRFAFAYDKLLRRMREAGADFDKQMLAQFGISPYDARHGKCIYLGGFTNRLSASDVTNMTGTDIGDLAGQINSYNDHSGKLLHYHAKEHGYIIGIYSTSVDNMYQSYRSSRETLLRDRFDWFNSAFENLGLQPVFQAEIDNTDKDNYNVTTIKPSSYSTIIGYVPRYSELKTHVDECHGVLCNYSDVVGYKEWNVQTNFDSRGTTEPLQRGNMLLNPKMFDAVAGVQYDGKQTSDHFIVNVYNHSRKVSAMSMFETF